MRAHASDARRGHRGGQVIKSGDQQNHLDHLRSVYRGRCNRLCDALLAGGFEIATRPVGGYFVWVKLPAGVTSKLLAPVAADHGVKFLAGERCCPQGEMFTDHVRLCFAYLEEDSIVEGVQRLKAAVDEVQLSRL
mmetsp:Transcript_24505/g.46457  ORF Transcript_24505/g.46457 Transcript_24505/m.46457 type:complete len:135 (+) Transcript_24505:1149-1553(+)